MYGIHFPRLPPKRLKRLAFSVPRLRIYVHSLWKVGASVGRQKHVGANGPGKARSVLGCFQICSTHSGRDLVRSVEVGM